MAISIMIEFACILLVLGIIGILATLGILVYSIGFVAFLAYISTACITIGSLLIYLEIKSHEQ